MIGATWIAVALFAWMALYQVIIALIVRPPLQAELRAVSGLVRTVDTSVPRDRHEPFSELVVEVAPARTVRLPMRHATMDRAAAERLVGRRVTAQVAAERPRNRWIYALMVEGEDVVPYAREHARDDTRRRDAVGAALASGALSLVLALGIWRRQRRAT
jgi:hypothetical protein